MRIACWIPKATNTHLEYIILISFPLQQWLHERSSVLGYTYIACLCFLASLHLMPPFAWAFLLHSSVSSEHRRGKEHGGSFSSHTRGTACRPTCGLRGTEGFNTKHFLSLTLMVLLLYEQHYSSWN